MRDIALGYEAETMKASYFRGDEKCVGKIFCENGCEPLDNPAAGW
jgi:hypothetical protein